MKKVMIVLAAAAILTSCGNSDFESVWSEYQEVSANKDDKKDNRNVNFDLFNDHYQKGKGEIK